MTVQGTLKILIEINGQPGSLQFRAVEEINHDMILGIDFGVEWNQVINLRARLWKSEEHGEWHSFASSKEDSTTAIMAECAGLYEMTPSEADRIKAIVERLVHKPTTDYLPTTHLTEHHIELTDYTPTRHHPRRRSPVMWAIVQEVVRDMHKAGVIERSASGWCHAPVIQKKSDGKYRF